MDDFSLHLKKEAVPSHPASFFLPLMPSRSRHFGLEIVHGRIMPSRLFLIQLTSRSLRRFRRDVLKYRVAHEPADAAPIIQKKLERNSLDNCGIVALDSAGKVDGGNAKEHAVVLVVHWQAEHLLQFRQDLQEPLH